MDGMGKKMVNKNNEIPYRKASHTECEDRCEFEPLKLSPERRLWEPMYFRPFIGVITPFITSRGPTW